MSLLDAMFLLAPVGSILALVFAAFQAKGVLKFPEGSDVMKSISQKIRIGANAYLKRQYKTVGLFFVGMFVVLGVMAFFNMLTPFVPFAFITGGFFSGLSGFVGMKIATAANARTANASSESLNKGLRVAFSSGTVMGFTVVGLGLLDLSIWFFLLRYAFAPYFVDVHNVDELVSFISQAMLTFGMGASSMALFARVGGGIFTKAADVGADLVGKVEAGIPEDDPRNPAVIADNVGDNVGDVAGMGADLYESYVGSIVATIALAVSAFKDPGDPTSLGAIRGASVPMIMAAVGTLASIVGTFFVRTGEKASQRALLSALRKGTYISSGIIVVAAFPIIWFALGPENIGVYGAVLSGLIAGVLVGFFTEYYTSDTYKPTRRLADSSLTGPATLIISGLSLGMVSTFLPVVIVGISVLVSYYASGGAASFAQGLYGVGISAVGMLSTLGITLATDAYGPVADNAGGIAEMSGLPESVRERTDALDSLGNTTAATGKGFAIGSAALTALALIVAYTDEIAVKAPDFIFHLDLTYPPTLIGLFIGAMLPFLFSSMTMQAVGRAAQGIVVEVRRQFKEIKGLLEGKPGVEADYAKCVDICTGSAQREMVGPALTGIAAPIVVGLILGVNGVVGMLAGATATGFVLAVMMSNAGGAWDNAKKFIEAGKHGGKGSDAHKAAVVGDTVGDPFKDTSGPSINILIKLLSMVSIVFAGLTLTFNLVDTLFK
ncbi:MAG: sodium-translocating pyrophosphatase [Clostridiales bacterium]|jgi:K(+)-stimulated pyrophosphate-energized sodium pump|nr:sodium-translocating pyrophosphatase [Clostridiales bacterium]